MELYSKLSPGEIERLALLVEELGETVQAIGKIVRHGYESSHPNGGPTNREHLATEMGDVIAALDLMTMSDDLDPHAIDQACIQKTARVGKYLHHNDVGASLKRALDEECKEDKALETMLGAIRADLERDARQADDARQASYGISSEDDMVDHGPFLWTDDVENELDTPNQSAAPGFIGIFHRDGGWFRQTRNTDGVITTTGPYLDEKSAFHTRVYCRR